jgi:hypothetical protein
VPISKVYVLDCIGAPPAPLLNRSLTYTVEYIFQHLWFFFFVNFALNKLYRNFLSTVYRPELIDLVFNITRFPVSELLYKTYEIVNYKTKQIFNVLSKLLYHNALHLQHGRKWTGTVFRRTTLPTKKELSANIALYSASNNCQECPLLMHLEDFS